MNEEPPAKNLVIQFPVIQVSYHLKQCRWVFDCHIQQVFHFCTDWVTSTWERMIWNLEKVLTCHSIPASFGALQLPYSMWVFPGFWKQNDFYCTYANILLIRVCQQHAYKIKKSNMHSSAPARSGGQAPVLPLLAPQVRENRDDLSLFFCFLSWSQHQRTQFCCFNTTAFFPII